MIKLFFLIIFLVGGSYSLRADELASDQEFMKSLDSVKNPFDDGLPKPVVIPKPVYHPLRIKPRPRLIPRPPPVPVPVELPDLKLQGVMVGEDMHEAIINDQIVPVEGNIEGARVVSVTKQDVELVYKGKKFFLKVD